MTKTLKFSCRTCKTTREIPQTKLATYYGKKIQVPCKNCGTPISIKVNADLLNKKANAPTGFQTEVIEQKSENQYKLAKIEILGNELTAHQIIPLEKGENILGRKSDAGTHENKRSINTRDKKISRLHCKIIVEENNGDYHYLLMDNASVNRTYLNDEALEKEDKVYIQSEDTIRIGITKLKLKL